MTTFSLYSPILHLLNASFVLAVRVLLAALGEPADEAKFERHRLRTFSPKARGTRNKAPEVLRRGQQRHRAAQAEASVPR